MDSPALSVIISNYNHAAYLEQAVGAILDQSHRPTEILITDDASTDQSAAILERLSKQNPRIRFSRNDTNLGVVRNYIIMLQAVRGEYVYFAATDDCVLPGFFSASLDLLEQHPNAGLCSALSYQIDASGKKRGLLHGHRRPLVDAPGYIGPDQVRTLFDQGRHVIHGNTVIYRRENLLAIGGFDDQLGFFIDGFAQLVLALRHGFCHIPEPLCCFRVTGENFSSIPQQDPDRWLSIMNRACALMRSDFPDLFPEPLVSRMEHQCQIDFILKKWALTRMSQNRILSLMRRQPPRLPLGLDALFYLTMSTLARGQTWLFKRQLLRFVKY